MKLQLDKWQEEVLKEEGNLLFAKGRRIGATYIFARKAVEYLMKHENTHPSSQMVCVSLTEDQAHLILAFATLYAQENYKSFIGKGKDKPTLNRLVLKVNKNRRILLSRPVGNTGDAARGFEGQILMVDEAPRMPKSFWIAAKPILATTGGKVWMWGTFFGREGYFWEQFHKSYELKEANARFKAFHKTTEDVAQNRPISGSWTKEQRKEMIQFLKDEKKDMSNLEYAQEYLGVASADLMQFFPDQLIQDCQTAKRRPFVFTGRQYFLGVDVARMGSDESTFEVIDRTNRDRLVQVENLITTKTLTTMTTREILKLNRQYELKKIYIDDGGMGVGVFDQLLEEDATRRKTIAINNASRALDRDEKRKKKLLKEDLYNNLLRLMERNEIQLLDDPEIFQSLKSVQYEYTDRGLRIFGNYTHIVEGLIRAAWCVKDKSLKMFIDYI